MCGISSLPSVALVVQIHCSFLSLICCTTSAVMVMDIRLTIYRLFTIFWHVVFSLCSHCAHILATKFDGAEYILSIDTESHLKLSCGTSFPFSLPLHINLSPKQQLTDWLTRTPSVTCYPYCRCCLLPKHKVGWLMQKLHFAYCIYWTSFLLEIFTVPKFYAA